MATAAFTPMFQDGVPLRASSAYQDGPPITPLRASSAMASLRFKTTSADKELLEVGYKYNVKRQPDGTSIHSA